MTADATMDMRRLEAFRFTVLHGTMLAAAERLKTSQPTISRLLSELEISVGFPLFTRRKGRVVPTKEGMEFHNRLEEVFGAFVKLRSAASDIRRDRNRAVRAISLPALSMTVVPQVLEEFAKRRPDVTVSLMTVDIPTYFSLIREADVDIAFGNQLGNQPGVEQITLAEVEYVCALPKAHRLAAQTSVDVQDLVGEKIISLSEMNHGVFRRHDEVFESIEGNFERKFVTQNSAIAYALVQKGLGIAVLEPFSAPIWHALGVETRPFSPQLRYRYAACFNTNAIRSESTKMLLQIAKKVFSTYKVEAQPPRTSTP